MRTSGSGRDGFEGAQALLDDAVGGVGAGGKLVLRGQAEEEQAAEAKRGAGFGFLDRLVDGEVEDAGHGGDLFAYTFAGAEEERIDQLAGMQMRSRTSERRAGVRRRRRRREEESLYFRTLYLSALIEPIKTG